MDNLSSVLEGQIAGYSDGIIRGVSTMNAQKTPLYVIDVSPWKILLLMLVEV